MMMVAEELGCNTYFIGAHRHQGLPALDRWSGYSVHRVGGHFPLANGRGLFRYILGVASFNLSSLKFLFQHKPSIVHVSDFDSYFAGWLYSLFSKSPLIYNIHDNLSQRYSLPKWVNRILNLAEGAFVLGSDATVVPEGFRKTALPEFCWSRIKVVRNTPADSGGYQPDSIPSLKKEVTVFFAGWIEKGRGIDALIELSKVPWISVVVAGDGDDELLDRIRQSGRIKYLGYLNHSEIMKQTSLSHFIFAFYDPVREINRYAAPNKVAEALSCGRPVIINSEVVLSGPVAQSNCGIVVTYGNADLIIQNISRLRTHPEHFQIMCKNARKMFEDSYSWDVAKKQIVEIYQGVFWSVNA